MRKKQIILAKSFTKKNKQIAAAYNNYEKSHPIMVMYARKVGNPLKEYLHAEVLCLIRSRKSKVEYLTIERYNEQGKMLLAKPCSVCTVAIKEAGVKYVKYTSENGWVTELVENL